MALWGSNSWSSFCGVDNEMFEASLLATLNEEGYTYERDQESAATMLGTEPTIVYDIELDPKPVTVKIFHASGDPVLRLANSFRTAENPLGGMCVLKAIFSKATEEELTSIMATTIEKLPQDPTDVSHHPRFRLAPIARWRIRRNWQRWEKGSQK